MDAGASDVCKMMMMMMNFGGKEGRGENERWDGMRLVIYWCYLCYLFSWLHFGLKRTAKL